MKAFFQVAGLDTVLALKARFGPVGSETIPFDAALGRIAAEDLRAGEDLPPFARATMDGYAVAAASTFGASDGSPALLAVKGEVPMGKRPALIIGPGEAAGISTGGALPAGADSVVMVEHAEVISEGLIEVYRSVAPGQHVITRAEDFQRGEVMVARGTRLRPQELGLMAAMGLCRAAVFLRPAIGVISTGDELVPVGETPGAGEIRDINTHTLAAMIREAGGEPVCYGLVKDDYDALLATCARAQAACDMVLISGGSSVGMRDFTIAALGAMPDARILVHGVSISPGKPTILASVQEKPMWGLPGQVTSAMVVFRTLVRPFIEHLAGLAADDGDWMIPARLTRNVASAQGRVDFIRVRLREEGGTYLAEPVLGKSGLIRTMVAADGLVEIDRHTEGLDKGALVKVRLLNR